MAIEQQYFQWLCLLQEIQPLNLQPHLEQKGPTMDYIPLFSYHPQRLVISNSSRYIILFKWLQYIFIFYSGIFYTYLNIQSRTFQPWTLYWKVRLWSLNWGHLSFFRFFGVVPVRWKFWTSTLFFSFQDAKEPRKNYFPVFVGDSIPDDIIDKYKTEAPKLMELFDGKKPKLCGTRTPMRGPSMSFYTNFIPMISKVYQAFSNNCPRYVQTTLQ